MRFHGSVMHVERFIHRIRQPRPEAKQRSGAERALDRSFGVKYASVVRLFVGAARWSSILDEWPQRSAQVSIRHGFVVSARLTTKTIFVWKRDIAQCKKIRDIDLDHKKMKENSKNK